MKEMLGSVFLCNQAWWLVRRVVERHRSGQLVEGDFKNWIESFHQNPSLSLLCLPLLRMTHVETLVSTEVATGVITWKLSTYNFPCSSSWGWESDVEVTFTAWNTPVTAGFAHTGQAQPRKPGNGKFLTPFKSTGWSIFLFFLWATEDYGSAGDSFGYSQWSLHWIKTQWSCSGSAEADFHHAKNILAKKPLCLLLPEMCAESLNSWRSGGGILFCWAEDLLCKLILAAA